MDVIKKKVLVIEDDKYLVNAYQVKLSKSGFEVRLAMDGDEALAVLKSFLPDIILLDLVVPKRDGFSVLEEIKKDPALAKIPVMISSNLGQKEDVDRGIKLGAVDYVIKSDISIDNILAKIRKVVA